MQQNAEQERNSYEFLSDEDLVSKVNEDWKINKINRPENGPAPGRDRGNRSYRGRGRGYSARSFKLQRRRK